MAICCICSKEVKKREEKRVEWRSNGLGMAPLPKEPICISCYCRLHRLRYIKPGQQLYQESIEAFNYYSTHLNSLNQEENNSETANKVLKQIKQIEVYREHEKIHSNVTNNIFHYMYYIENKFLLSHPNCKENEVKINVNTEGYSPVNLYFDEATIFYMRTNIHTLKINVNRLAEVILNEVQEVRCQVHDLVEQRKKLIELGLPLENNGLPLNKDELYGVNTIFNDNRMLENKNEQFKNLNVPKKVKDFIDENSFTLNISDIVYFEEKGDVKYSSNVTGGGSADVNIGGAVAGGMLFGAAGAVVGSKVGTGTDKISTTTVKHDDRYVYLKYNKNGKPLIKKLPFEWYDILTQITPEKEHSSYNDNDAKPVSNGDSEGVISKLKGIKELLDCGVLTQEEFNNQKEKLLREL